MIWVLLKVLHKFEGPLQPLTLVGPTQENLLSHPLDALALYYPCSEIGTSLDFDWSKEVWEQVVWISNGIQSSKSQDFLCFQISNGRISDPHCIYNFKICSSGTIEHAVVIELQHDSTYVIRLRACHRPNQNGLTRCSENAVKEVNQHLPSVVEE